ncbi:MAG TPA: hypothetical protein VFE47_08525 [Tepidisphaeraceae bacterium]|jgi:hypothetical protein|nr:hypothetical protein [Tepidisphaeraceae bacterium]
MFRIRTRGTHLPGSLIRAAFCVATGIALLLAIIHNVNANVGLKEQSKSVTIAPPGAPSIEQIDSAIDKAVQYLMSQQVNGKWDRPPDAGAAPSWRLTALVLLALTDAGQSPQNADIRKSTDILDEANVQDVQTAAMRAQFDGATAFARPNARITRGADVLAAAALTGKAPPRKAFTPMVGEAFGSQNPDHISSYFELLGLDACQENWAAIPGDFWKDADLQWRHHQLADGGWPFNASVQHDNPTESDFRSTAAGILALELMAVTPHAIDTDAFDGCKGNAVDPELEKAMVWLGQRAPQMCGDLAAGKLRHPCETCWWFEKVLQATGNNRITDRCAKIVTQFR